MLSWLGFGPKKEVILIPTDRLPDFFPRAPPPCNEVGDVSNYLILYLCINNNSLLFLFLSLLTLLSLIDFF
jgi:hypothetical protein